MNVSAQYDNIGDSLIRRTCLAWLRQECEVHVLAAHSPVDYLDALSLSSSDVVYRDRSAWMRALAASPRGSTSLVHLPGEVNLGKVRAQLNALALSVVARIAGGSVLMINRGVRDAALPGVLIFRVHLALGSLIFWRDVETATRFPQGRVMPDIGLQESQGPEVMGPVLSPVRDLLAVTMRGDRPSPSESWISAVRTFADEERLEIVALAQVRADNGRTAELAQRLACRCLAWAPSASHLAQESLVRDIYKRASCVISDRLHALVIGAREGAVPAALLTEWNGKPDRHLAAMGLHGVSHDASSGSAQASVAFLTAMPGRRSEVNRLVAQAQQEVAAVRDVVTGHLRDRAASG